jgi:LPXTG-motif cell wall-anchored protein
MPLRAGSSGLKLLITLPSTGHSHTFGSLAAGAALGSGAGVYSRVVLRDFVSGVYSLVVLVVLFGGAALTTVLLAGADSRNSWSGYIVYGDRMPFQAAISFQSNPKLKAIA